MSQNVDLRVRRTREQIRDAFMALLLERPFEQITVSAITQQARINRATFYRHYTDVNDLAARLTDLLFADIATHLEEQGTHSTAASWQILFTHVAEYATFYKAMMGPGGIPGFRERVETAVAAQMADLLPTFGFDNTRLRLPQTLAVRYLAAAQVGVIQWWLENEMPVTAATAAEYLINLHLHGGWWALGLEETA
ncbi:MAG: TetR/AcrR family transcriptional regulator [Chloroflexota bacterium]|nr:TetR/AcrR family transcriptional regulator C-terminal domain-containing protein [Anaerolineales bacterium]MCB8966795.1 TetR/AcrR family transcriptional regulator C-terminal domain-containing protein [Ardenticatenaceae bacterium]